MVSTVTFCWATTGFGQAADEGLQDGSALDEGRAHDFFAREELRGQGDPHSTRMMRRMRVPHLAAEWRRHGAHLRPVRPGPRQRDVERPLGRLRSEERRVGKEWRSRLWSYRK